MTRFQNVLNYKGQKLKQIYSDADNMQEEIVEDIKSTSAIADCMFVFEFETGKPLSFPITSDGSIIAESWDNKSTTLFPVSIAHPVLSDFIDLPLSGFGFYYSEVNKNTPGVILTFEDKTLVYDWRNDGFWETSEDRGPSYYFHVEKIEQWKHCALF